PSSTVRQMVSAMRCVGCKTGPVVVGGSFATPILTPQDPPTCSGPRSPADHRATHSGSGRATYLAAMAVDAGPSQTGEIARRMGVGAGYAQMYRRRLIDAE